MNILEQSESQKSNLKQRTAGAAFFLLAMGFALILTSPALAQIAATFDANRVPVEVEAWWQAEGTKGGHTHVTFDLPIGQKVSGTLNFNARVVMHELDSHFHYLILEDENSKAIAQIPLTDKIGNNFIMCPEGQTCAFNIPVTLDTAKFGCDGWHRLSVRLTKLYSDTANLSQEYFATATEIPLEIANGQPSCQAPADTAANRRFRGKGFQSSTGYACAELDHIPVNPADGLMTFYARACDPSERLTLELDKTHAIPATEDGVWPAVPASSGSLVFDRLANTQEPFKVMIDTRTLQNGWHWLKLRSVNPNKVRGAYPNTQMHQLHGIAVVYFYVEHDNQPPIISEFMVTPGAAAVMNTVAPTEFINGFNGEFNSAQLADEGMTFAWLETNTSGQHELKAQDMTSGASKVITQITDPAIDSFQRPFYISGDWAAYTRVASWNIYDSDLYLLNMKTGLEKRIMLEPQRLTIEAAPVIWGPYLIYIDHVYENTGTSDECPPGASKQDVGTFGMCQILDLGIYNIEDGTTQILTSSRKAVLVSAPKVAGDENNLYITWEDRRNGITDIYLLVYNRITHTSNEYQITNDENLQRSPDVTVQNGKVLITWIDSRNDTCAANGNTECSSGNDVFRCEFKAGQCLPERVTTMSRSNPYYYTNNNFPQFSNNCLLWSDYRNVNNDVYLYDINTGLERPLTSSLDAELGFINGTHVVFKKISATGETTLLKADYDICSGTVQETPKPTVTITSPHNGAVITTSTAIIAVDYEIDGDHSVVHHVDLQLDTQAKVTDNWDGGPSGTNTFNNVGIGAHTVHVYLVDAAGSVLDEDMISVTVSSTPTGTAKGNPIRVIMNVGGTGGGDFSLTVSPLSQTINAGGSTSYKVTVSATGGFNSPVNLSKSGFPIGVNHSVTPGVCVAYPCLATLNVTSNQGAPAGSYPITVTGTSGSLTRTQQVSLTINNGGGTCPSVTFFSPDPPSVNDGQTSKLSWSSNSIGCTGSSEPPDSSWDNGFNNLKPASGEAVVHPLAPQTKYELTCWSTGFDCGIGKYQTVTVTGGGTGNRPPEVNAGADQVITLPDQEVSLSDASVTDDGLLQPYYVNWSMVSGPAGGGVIFGNGSAVKTTARFTMIAGDYVLQLEARDGGFTVSDMLKITIKP